MASEFDSLRDILRREGAASLYETPIYAAPGRLSLQDLPDTLLVADDLDSAKMKYAGICASTRPRSVERKRAQIELETQERRYSDALRRDAIQSTRPAGCWCLGAGGKHLRYMPAPTDQTIVRKHDDEEITALDDAETFLKNCECTDGQRRAAQDKETIARYWRWRDRKAIENRFGMARLPKEYRDFPWRTHPDRAVVERVQGWLNDPKDRPESAHWLLLYGPGGRGKTTIMHGIATDRLHDGQSALFITTLDLIAEIRATFGKPEEQADLIGLLRRVEHLFLDDIGVEIPHDWIGEIFYGLLNHRHNEHMATYFTTNLDIQPLGAHLGERIWGRLKRMVEPIAMSGEDLRNRRLAARLQARKVAAK